MAQASIRRSALSRQLVTSELLDTATQLFAEKGYESTTLLDIAQALGISRPALYNYVRSKEDLLTMLVERVSRGLADALAQLTARAELSPTQKLRDLVGLLVRQRTEHPHQFRILDRSEMVLPEPVGSQHREAKRAVLREVRAIIDEGIERGEFTRADSRTAALSLLGMCNWVAWWFSRGDDAEATVRTVTELAERMLISTSAGNSSAETVRAVEEIRTLLDRIAPTAAPDAHPGSRRTR